MPFINNMLQYQDVEGKTTALKSGRRALKMDKKDWS